MSHEVGDVELALSRKAAVVAAPLQEVQGDHRRVGDLHEDDLLARDLLDRRRVAASGEDVEGVQTDPEVRAVGELDDPPRVAVVVDVGAPGERLEGDPDPVLRRRVGQCSQLAPFKRHVTLTWRRARPGDPRAPGYAVRPVFASSSWRSSWAASSIALWRHSAAR